MSRPTLVFVVGVAATLVGPTARAQDEDEGVPALEARLGLFNRTERELLDPYLERGPVLLVEYAAGSALPAIVAAVLVEAPADRVATIVGNPLEYPRFMPALDDVQIKASRPPLLAYDWTWRTSLFTLRGSNVMTRWPPPGARADRPYRVDVRATRGDLGTGRIVWRVYPKGPRRSLLVISARLDVRDANYVTRTINEGRRSTNRTINISLGLVMLFGTKRYAEGRGSPNARTVLADASRPELQPLNVNALALAALLGRGDLLFFEVDRERLLSVAVLGRCWSPVEPIRTVMQDPAVFGPALIDGSYARIVREEPGELEFDWGVDIPLLGTEGRMRLVRTPDVVSIDATSGALTGGQWRFLLAQYPWQEAVVFGWARFDPRSANWLIAALVNGTPDFGTGIVAGTQIMALRALRNRGWEIQAEQAQ